MRSELYGKNIFGGFVREPEQPVCVVCDLYKISKADVRGRIKLGLIVEL